MYTVTKTYPDLPAAHRQHNHSGHCRFIHGHNWTFEITFGCAERDATGFVVDVGRLSAVKQFLTATFDHTLLLNADDPYLVELQAKLVGAGGLSFAEIVVVPNCGMEALAQYVFEKVSNILQGRCEQPLNTDWISDCKNRKVVVLEVVCHEDSKNRATYRP